MIAGIGVDLVEIERMEALWQRHGARAARRLLSVAERSAAPTITPRLLAKRFAAKEALAKALGTGLRHPVSLQSISVIHDALGRPGFQFSPELAAYIAGLGVHPIHLSLTDERLHAMAFVVAEKV